MKQAYWFRRNFGRPCLRCRHATARQSAAATSPGRCTPGLAARLRRRRLGIEPKRQYLSMVSRLQPLRSGSAFGGQIGCDRAFGCSPTSARACPSLGRSRSKIPCASWPQLFFFALCFKASLHPTPVRLGFSWPLFAENYWRRDCSSL
jgi:hypothetical protein